MPPVPSIRDRSGVAGTVSTVPMLPSLCLVRCLDSYHTIRRQLCTVLIAPPRRFFSRFFTLMLEDTLYEVCFDLGASVNCLLI